MPAADALTRIIGFHGVMQDLFHQGGFNDLLSSGINLILDPKEDENLFKAIKNRCTYMLISKQEAANRYLGMNKAVIDKLGKHIAFNLGPAIAQVECIDGEGNDTLLKDRLTAKLCGINETKMTDVRLVARYENLLADYPLKTLENLSYAQLEVLKSGHCTLEEINYPWFSLGSSLCILLAGIKDVAILRNITVSQMLLYQTLRTHSPVSIEEIINVHFPYGTLLAMEMFHLNTHLPIADIRQLLLINGIHAFGLVVAGLTREQVFRPDFTRAQVGAMFFGGMNYDQAMSMDTQEAKYWRLVASIGVGDIICQQKKRNKITFKNAAIDEEAVFSALSHQLISIDDLMDIITLEKARAAARKMGWTESEVSHKRFGVEHVIALKSGCESDKIKSLTRNQALFLALSIKSGMEHWYVEPLDIDPMRSSRYISERIIDGSALEKLNENQFFFLILDWTLDEVTKNEITQIHKDACLNYGISARRLIGLNALEVSDLIHEMLMAKQFNAQYDCFEVMKAQVIGRNMWPGSFFKNHENTEEEEDEEMEFYGSFRKPTSL